MLRFLLVIILIVLILFIFRNISKRKLSSKKDIYKKLIFVLIVGAFLLFVATSGKFILPQIFQILKIGLPFLTKFIGI